MSRENHTKLFILARLDNTSVANSQASGMMHTQEQTFFYILFMYGLIASASANVQTRGFIETWIDCVSLHRWDIVYFLYFNWILYAREILRISRHTQQPYKYTSHNMTYVDLIEKLAIQWNNEKFYWIFASSLLKWYNKNKTAM